MSLPQPLSGVPGTTNQAERAAPAPHPAEIETLARAIERAGMSDTAMLALRVARPLSWLGGQMLWVLHPLLSSLGAGSRGRAHTVSGLAAFLEGEGNVEKLIERLEAPNAGRKHEPE